jgi:hypothetical protein
MRNSQDLTISSKALYPSFMVRQSFWVIVYPSKGVMLVPFLQ